MRYHLEHAVSALKKFDSKMAPQAKINCIITGAGGFVGQALASALLVDPLVSKLTLTDVLEPTVPKLDTQTNVECHCLQADLTSIETCQALFTPDFNLIYILHGIMSGAAEVDFELGLKVNLDSTRQILDVLRHTNPGVKVIYPSSLAVYGPPATPTSKITELNTPVPGTSYGAQKHICETLLDDYSRRGFLDGRTLRLPTVSKAQSPAHILTPDLILGPDHCKARKAHWSGFIICVRNLSGTAEWEEGHPSGLQRS